MDDFLPLFDKPREPKPPEKPPVVPPTPPAAQEPPVPDGQESLESARRRYFAALRDGTDCPCCDRFGKIYNRNLHAGLARSLITFYKWSLVNPGGWFHPMRDFSLGKNGPTYVASDYAMLLRWSLVETRIGRAADGNPKIGLFRVTDLGVKFVKDQTRVFRYVLVYDDEIVDSKEEADKETVSIREALGDDFNYRELMEG